jgi:hypothetical protein
MAASRFAAIRDHVLLPWASRLEESDRRLRPLLGEELFARIVAQIPDDWLQPEPGLSADDRRAGYVEFLTKRLAAASFLEEAVHARAKLV